MIPATEYSPPTIAHTFVAKWPKELEKIRKKRNFLQYQTKFKILSILIGCMQLIWVLGLMIQVCMLLNQNNVTGYKWIHQWFCFFDNYLNKTNCSVQSSLKLPTKIKFLVFTARLFSILLNVDAVNVQYFTYFSRSVYLTINGLSS